MHAARDAGLTLSKFIVKKGAGTRKRRGGNNGGGRQYEGRTPPTDSAPSDPQAPANLSDVLADFMTWLHSETRKLSAADRNTALDTAANLIKRERGLCRDNKFTFCNKASYPSRPPRRPPPDPRLSPCDDCSETQTQPRSDQGAVRKVAHLTYMRQMILPASKDWPITEIMQELNQVVEQFLHLAPARLLDPRWRQPRIS